MRHIFDCVITQLSFHKVMRRQKFLAQFYNTTSQRRHDEVRFVFAYKLDNTFFGIECCFDEPFWGISISLCMTTFVECNDRIDGFESCHFVFC